MIRIAVSVLTLLFISACGSDSKKPPNEGGSNPPPDEQTETEAPQVEPISLLTKQDEPVVVALKGQLKTSATLSYEIVSLPSNGSLNLSGESVTYTPTAGYFGPDQFTYRASVNGVYSENASANIYVVKGQAQSAFWLKSENIKTSGTDGSVILDWADAVSGQSATFKSEARTPRFIENIGNSQRGAKFEFIIGGFDTNDFMYFASTYLYSELAGITLFAVGESKGSSSSIAPVFALGDWTTKGFGFHWNPQNAGIVSSTKKDGRDDRSIYPITTTGLALMTAQIRFSTGGDNGFQRVRFNQGAWAQKTEGIDLRKLTDKEVDVRSAPSLQGGPIVIGANNDADFQPDRRFNGNLGEVLVINDFLSDSDLETIETALKKKFGIQ